MLNMCVESMIDTRVPLIGVKSLNLLNAVLLARSFRVEEKMGVMGVILYPHLELSSAPIAAMLRCGAFLAEWWEVGGSDDKT
jgi:hypothetical protein